MATFTSGDVMYKLLIHAVCESETEPAGQTFSQDLISDKTPNKVSKYRLESMCG